MTDPIADMLARMRNAQAVGKETVPAPDSKLRRNVLDVLKREGYIRGYTVAKNDKGFSEISIELKYRDGMPVIQFSKKVSKPGRKVYSSVNDLPMVFNGLGISVLSTNKGMMSDSEAREANVGGEILCNVY